MPNYTKGEWTVSSVKDFEGNNLFAIYGHPDNRVQRVADVWIEANAQLIAAGPKMHQFILGLANKGDKEAIAFIETLDL